VQRFSRFVLDSSEDEHEDHQLRALSRAGPLKDDLQFVEKIANSDSPVAKRLIKLFEISRKDKTDKQEMKKIKSSVQARSSFFGVIKRQHSSQVLKIVEESKEES